jgi:signal transduction histidine kinase
MTESHALNGWVRCLSSALDGGLLLLDENGALSLVNQRGLDLLGRDEAQLQAEWPELRRRIDEQRPDGVWSGGESEHEVALPVGGDGGQREFLLEIVPVDVDECRGHVVQLRDLTEVRATERDMLLASQMHSISALYRSMVHDLRAPLNAMVVNLELLGDSVAPGATTRPDVDERRRRYVRVLKEEMGRLNRHLQAFLSQTTPAALYGARRFDLVPMLAEMELFVEPQASKQKISLAFDLPAEAVEVDGSADQVRQAVLSLVVNAFEALAGRAGGRVEVGVRRRGGEALLWVEDDGPGVPAEAAGRVFDLHFTTKGDGSGIGLYVARAVVERHGGTLTLTRRDGPAAAGGARFEISLPTRAAEAAEET